MNTVFILFLSLFFSLSVLNVMCAHHSPPPPSKKSSHVPYQHTKKSHAPLSKYHHSKKEHEVVPPATKEEFCSQIPQAVPNKCYADKLIQEESQCEKTYQKEVCKVEVVDKPCDTCHELVDKVVTYPCFKIKEDTVCMDVPYNEPKTCQEKVPWVKEFPCPKSIPAQECSYKSIPDTCYRTGSRKEEYKCTEIKTEEVCKMFPYTVNKTCYKEKPQMESYPCDKMIEKDVCKKVPKEVDGECSKTVYDKEPYNCHKNVPREECNQVDEEVWDKCTRMVPVQEPYKCSKTKTEMRCRKVPSQVPNVCYKTVETKEPFDCSTTKYKTECNQHECKGKECKNFRHDGKSSLCKQVPVSKAETCYRNVTNRIPYDCFKTAWEKVCEEVEAEVPDKCFKTVDVPESYKCQKTVPRTVCKTVWDSVDHTCFKKVARKEVYACPKIEYVKACNKVPFNSKGACERKVMVKVPYSCPVQKEKEVCNKQKVAVDAVCKKTLPTTEEYQCKKQVKECKEVATEVSGLCYEVSSRDEPYPCPEIKKNEVCETIKVAVDDDCTVTLKESKQISCVDPTETLTCDLEKETVPWRCFEDVEKKVPYKCFDIKYETSCHQKTVGKKSHPVISPPSQKKQHVKQSKRSKWHHHRGY